MRDADRRAVSRVRAYPFRPDADGIDPLRAFALGGGWAGDGAGAPLAAFGSNASRSMLAAKLGVGAHVSAEPGRLEGFDAVFSAHVSPHGAIPATLAPSAGTSIAVVLLVMDPAALDRLDATEPNYRRERVGEVQAYVSRHGPLLLDAGPWALRAVPARGRVLPELDQAQVLERVRARLEPGTDPDGFVLAQIRDTAIRAARTRALRAG